MFYWFYYFIHIAIGISVKSHIGTPLALMPSMSTYLNLMPKDRKVDNQSHDETLFEFRYESYRINIVVVSRTKALLNVGVKLHVRTYKLYHSNIM